MDYGYLGRTTLYQVVIGLGRAPVLAASTESLRLSVAKQRGLCLTPSLLILGNVDLGTRRPHQALGYLTPLEFP